MKTGTLKNVASFEKLVGICNDLGARYNPSKTDISTTALADLLERAHTSIETVDNARTTYVNAVNNRQLSFSKLGPLTIRIMSALVASGASAESVHDARLLKRKLLSQKSIVIPGKDGSPDQKSSGVSHLDYENKAGIFAQLIKHLESTAAYAPNEEELKLSALKAYHTTLRTSSHAVMVAANALAQARNQRNTVLRGKGGLHEIVTAVKAYIRSICGRLRDYPANNLGMVRITI